MEVKSLCVFDKLYVFKLNYCGVLCKLIECCYGDKNWVKGLVLGEYVMYMFSVIEVNNILGNEYVVECFEECIR